MGHRRRGVFWELSSWVRRWGYRLEKGRPHVVGLTAVLSLLVPLSLVCALVMVLAGQHDSFAGAVW